MNTVFYILNFGQFIDWIKNFKEHSMDFRNHKLDRLRHPGLFKVTIRKTLSTLGQ